MFWVCDQTPGKDLCHLPLATPPDPSPTSVVLAADKSLRLMSLRALNHSHVSGTCTQLSQLLTHWPFGDVEHSYLRSQHTCVTPCSHLPSQCALPTNTETFKSQMSLMVEKSRS